MTKSARGLLAAIPLLLVAARSDAAPQPTPVYVETWETPTDPMNWVVNSNNDAVGDPTDDQMVDTQSDFSSTCSTTYQRETFLAHQGRAFSHLVMSGTNIQLTAATPYCISVWIRGSASPTLGSPAFGIVENLGPTDTATTASNFVIATAAASPSVTTIAAPDGGWHWYTADYTSGGTTGSVYIAFADEVWDGESVQGGTADFDDLAIYPGPCSALSQPPTHQTCGGKTSICESTTSDPAFGQCVQCDGNLDCAGTPSTPICTNHACVGCSGNPDCAGTPATPICDTGSGTCVQCTASTDCPNTSPVCSSDACGACGSDGDCTGRVGATHCDVTADADQGQCVQCNGDGDCTSGQICNASHACVTGCHNNTGCTGGTFCTSETGALGMCTTTCDFDNQCTSGQICLNGTGHDGGAGSSFCAQCASDTNCTATPATPACTNTYVCGECSASNKTLCLATGNGSACLADNTCGCAADADCGGTTSGRICDGASNKCVVGCRGTGGNGCGTGMVCSSTNGSPGTCSAAAPADMTVLADMTATPPGADMTATPAGADMTTATTGDMSTTPVATPDMNNSQLGGGGGGCNCDVSNGGDSGSVALFFLVAFAFVLRRRFGVRF